MSLIDYVKSITNEDDGCMIYKYTSPTIRCGEEIQYPPKPGRNARMLAKVAIYEAHTGTFISNKQTVISKCGNPRCLNPVHLSAVAKTRVNSTRAKAGRARINKTVDRLQKFKACPYKMSVDAYQDLMRLNPATGKKDKAKELSEKFNRSWRTILGIWNGKSYKMAQMQNNPFIQLMP